MSEWSICVAEWALCFPIITDIFCRLGRLELKQQTLTFFFFLNSYRIKIFLYALLTELEFSIDSSVDIEKKVK